MQQTRLKHQYLEAMGVTSWLPRCQLPGAAPSADWVKDFRYPGPDIPFTSPASSGIQQPDQAEPRPASGARAALAALGAAPDAAVEVKSVSPPVQQSPDQAESGLAAVPVAEDITPTFKLAFFRVGNCLVVDSLPPQGGAFSATYQRLARAIVHSLQLQGETSEPDLMPWPMFASKTLDQRWPEAAKSVAYKLHKELQQPTRAVLLCGEAAAQMVLQRQDALDELQGILFSLPTSAKAIAGPSLSELMHVPGAKKTLWQALQPLSKHLSTHA
ncbi:hypothetical protein ACFVYJ_02500 [Pontibacter sp. JAM-7]|uniref:hypothetical protein n=1 Tax=Pontibacter sp. JAM-7 TaxID=3366581 RepID=UPI003AF86721